MAPLRQRLADADPTGVARRLIDRHGLRAAAVASEYVAEAQGAGDAAALHRARQVQAAIAELRSAQRRSSEFRPSFA